MSTQGANSRPASRFRWLDAHLAWNPL